MEQAYIPNPKTRDPNRKRVVHSQNFGLFKDILQTPKVSVEHVSRLAYKAKRRFVFRQHCRLCKAEANPEFKPPRHKQSARNSNHSLELDLRPPKDETLNQKVRTWQSTPNYDP